MSQNPPHRSGIFATAVLLGFTILAQLASGHDHMSATNDGETISDDQFGNSSVAAMKPDYPPTYFALKDHHALIYAHVVLMILAWVFALPVAVMLSIARSRLALPLQLAFLSANVVGIVFAAVYDAKTPDLYPNNAHHRLGWVATWTMVAQLTIGAIGRVAGTRNQRDGLDSSERQAFIPASSSDHWHGITDDYADSSACRLSNDSGQGTEPKTESLRSNSISSHDGEGSRDENHEFDISDEHLNLLPKEGFLTSNAIRFASTRGWTFVKVAYCVIDRIILPLGFIALTTGIVTFGRFFEGKGIFSGLAHWIKGGVFIWFGLFTLGRWSGSFADLGWAWNLQPLRKTNSPWQPTAEFLESGLIFFYGSTNIFLEHLGGWGGEWTAQDLEHMAITVLFIGGGLCGMLVESTAVRNLLNTTANSLEADIGSEEDGIKRRQAPDTYGISLNPIPALVILLLGILMSSHHQSTMISTMVHKQWGHLLLTASFARMFTYALLFIRPPTSVLPSRPPTELLAAFGLIAGGIIFMASSADTVSGMIHYELDAMFMYTVTMGLVGLLMAWVVVVLAIKGWALRRERMATRRAVG